MSSFYNKVTKQWLTKTVCDGRPGLEVQQDCNTDDETLEQTEDTDIDAGEYTERLRYCINRAPGFFSLDSCRVQLYPFNSQLG